MQIECLPYTNQQLEQFDKITLQYARWALGFQFKKVSSRLITFYELGLKPIHFDIMQSRISYFLHLLSRNHDHYTTCALSEIMKGTCKHMHKHWYAPLLKVIRKMKSIDFIGKIKLDDEEYIRKYTTVKNTNKRKVREVMRKAWNTMIAETDSVHSSKLSLIEKAAAALNDEERSNIIINHRGLSGTPQYAALLKTARSQRSGQRCSLRALRLRFGFLRPILAPQ